MFEFTIPSASAPQSPRWFAASIVAHGLVVLLLFAIRFSGISKFPTPQEHYTLIAPSRLAAPLPREFHPAHSTPLQATTRSEFIPPPALEIPKPVLPEISYKTPPLPNIPPVMPSAPAVEPTPLPKTTGFEIAESSANPPPRRPLSMLGSFESARTAEAAPVRAKVPQPGAFADASSTPVVASRKSISSAAFGDTTVEKGAASLKQIAAARFTPIEILSKPKAQFTAEARAKDIEGEVLLEVEFSASGTVRVLRVVRGLGHGLDENAIAAAEGIRFHPAARDGAVVNYTALVHIVFQLAN